MIKIPRTDRPFLLLALILPLFFTGCATQKSNEVSRAVKTTATKIAKKQMGAPYRYGGNSPNQGFDCSGLIFYSYTQAGIKMPRSTADQFRQFKSTKKPNVGDLVFFGTRGKANHSGIYLGGKKMLHAPTTGKRVEIVKFDSPHWQKNYLGAKIVTTQ